MVERSNKQRIRSGPVKSIHGPSRDSIASFRRYLKQSKGSLEISLRACELIEKLSQGLTADANDLENPAHIATLKFADIYHDSLTLLLKEFFQATDQLTTLMLDALTLDRIGDVLGRNGSITHLIFRSPTAEPPQWLPLNLKTLTLLLEPKKIEAIKEKGPLDQFAQSHPAISVIATTEKPDAFGSCISTIGKVEIRSFPQTPLSFEEALQQVITNDWSPLPIPFPPTPSNLRFLFNPEATKQTSPFAKECVLSLVACLRKNPEAITHLTLSEVGVFERVSKALPLLQVFPHLNTLDLTVAPDEQMSEIGAQRSTSFAPPSTTSTIKAKGACTMLKGLSNLKELTLRGWIDVGKDPFQWLIEASTQKLEILRLLEAGPPLFENSLIITYDRAAEFLQGSSFHTLEIYLQVSPKNIDLFVESFPKTLKELTITFSPDTPRDVYTTFQQKVNKKNTLKVTLK